MATMHASVCARKRAKCATIGSLRLPRSQRELRAAAVADPDAVAIGAPIAIEDAVGAAELMRQFNAEAGVSAAVVARRSVRLANQRAHGLALPAAAVRSAVVGDQKLGAAAAVDPDAVAVIPPRPTLNAVTLASELAAEFLIADNGG